MKEAVARLPSFGSPSCLSLGGAAHYLTLVLTRTCNFSFSSCFIILLLLFAVRLQDKVCLIWDAKDCNFGRGFGFTAHVTA